MQSIGFTRWFEACGAWLVLASQSTERSQGPFHKGQQRACLSSSRALAMTNSPELYNTCLTACAKAGNLALYSALLFCAERCCNLHWLHHGSIAPVWPQAAMDVSAPSFVGYVQAAKCACKTCDRNEMEGLLFTSTRRSKAASDGFASHCSHAFRQTLR